MDKFQAMQVFARVVETNSFSRAAEALRVPRASVTRVIQEFEGYLNVRLLNRTTRSLGVTAEGAAFYQRCVQILADVDAAEGELSDAVKTPRGEIRIDMPGWLGKQVVLPALRRFERIHPDISLVLGFSDRLVDLVQEGVDCAIRIGELSDSSLVARQVGNAQLLTVASRGYGRTHGLPNTIEDLAEHRLVGYISSRTGRPISPTFSVGTKEVGVRMQAAISANDVDACLRFVQMGFGVAQLPGLLAQPLIDTGELVELLPEHRPAPLPISLLYPQSRHIPPQVRAFSNWTSDLIGSLRELRIEPIYRRSSRLQSVTEVRHQAEARNDPLLPVGTH